jgi:tetratricopeptide (TPR) repeat protein
MSENLLRYPKLETFYQQFLENEDSARFIKFVSENYLIGTLVRLVHYGTKTTRRAAILAIGFLGDYSLNETMGNALNDSDRAVRLLAEHNIRQIWQRQGSDAEQKMLARLDALNTSNQPDQAVELATKLIRANRHLGEAWNQRAIAYTAIGCFDKAIADCRETLNCNRFHYMAAVGMGHCCLQLEDALAALECFRLAISINPDLESLRSQIAQLERILKDD